MKGSNKKLTLLQGHYGRVAVAVLIRVTWMVIFLLGTTLFAWLELRSDSGSAMVWFMLTGLWSAVCGIVYTIHYWYVIERPARNSCQ
jgi:hypothetical protein